MKSAQSWPKSPPPADKNNAWIQSVKVPAALIPVAVSEEALCLQQVSTFAESGPHSVKRQPQSRGRLPLWASEPILPSGLDVGDGSSDGDMSWNGWSLPARGQEKRSMSASRA